MSYAAKLFPALTFSLLLAGGATTARADALFDKIKAAGNGLVNDQDPGTNLWNSGFQSFNGTILAGLTRAYINTGNLPFLTNAQDGATSMISFYQIRTEYAGLYLPDEVFSLTAISALQGTPSSNAYRTAASSFFSTAVPAHSSGTTGYISSVSTIYSDPSHSVIDLSYLTVAAFNVNASAKSQFRTALLASLANVSDTGNFPTASLGAAVWALAQTGGLTGNVSAGTGPLSGVALATLPATLDARLDPATKLFNYTLAGHNIGVTDDTALALLGLETAPATYLADIQASELALSAAITAGTGATHYDPLNRGSVTADAYAGRALQALNPVPEPASLVFVALGSAALICRRRLPAPQRTA